MAEMLVCRDGEMAEGGVRIVRAGKFEIGVIRHEGKYYAYRNYCPHQGGPVGEGSIANGWLRCWSSVWMIWAFDHRPGCNCA